MRKRTVAPEACIYRFQRKKTAVIIRVINDRLTWAIGLIDASGLPFLSGDGKPGQPGQVRGRRKTANWILATGGNHDPRKVTGTQYGQ